MNAKTILFACLATAFLAVSPRAQIGQQWVARFDGTGSNADFVKDVTHDGAGNIYVVGATRVDVPPNIQAPRLLLIKYDAQGTEQWSRVYSGNQHPGTAFGNLVAVAPDGHVVVAGTVDGGQDWVVLRYDPAGNLLWDRVFLTGSASLTDPKDLEIDAQGNIYVTGSTPSFQSSSAARTLKYDPLGNLLWEHSFHVLIDPATASSLAVDQAGNVYVAGTLAVQGLSGEMCVHKLDASGALQWWTTYGHFSPTSYDSASDIALDSVGRVVVCGTVGWSTSPGSDIALIKLSSAGTLMWDRTFDGPAARSDSGARLRLDPEDNAYVLGSTSMSFSDTDVVTLRYGPAGVLHWSNVYGGPALTYDYEMDMAVDVAGRVYVTGQVFTLTNAGGYFTIRYDANGTLDWEAIYNGPLGGFSMAFAVSTDSAGNVYVTGESDGLGTGTDIATIRYGGAEHTVYCTAKVNSLGCVPSIAGLGTPSATAGSGFVVTGTLVRNRKAGLLLYGVSGRGAAPFQGGTLCLTPAIKRTPGGGSGGHSAPVNDCSGSYTIDMNAFAAGLIGGKPLPALALPGTVVDAQWWGRDQGFAPPNNTTLSNGLEYTVGP